jgi:DNA polymerase I-like protein with 3'-5' exonuclease and polymerase domains
MRKYILPDPGQVFVSADFHSQEVRILGHYAGGTIAEIYQNDPSADVHQIAANIILEQSGIETTRKATKTIAFSILYGAGVRRIADQLGCSVEDAANLKRAYLDALVGVKEFMWEVESRAASKQPVRTWGGRLLYAPPTVIRDTGAVWNRDYALLNYLIQGSAADQTKQAIVDYERERKHGRFLLTVHDEICVSVPKKHLKTEVEILKRVMAAGKFDLPMRAAVLAGPNWTTLGDIK